jgi:hypothetical protein
MLPYLIDNQLVMEEGKAKNITVPDADVEADLQQRGKSDPAVAELLKTPGPNMAFAQMQVKRELTLQRLLTADVKAPTEEQLKTFLNKYQAYYSEPAKVKVGLLASSTKARADAMSRALKSKTKSFDQLVKEQKANQSDAAGFAISTDDRGQFELADNFPPGIGAQLLKLPKGGVTAPTAQNVGLPTPVYVIFKVVDIQPAKKPEFAALRPKLETDYKLAQVAQTEVKKNSTNPAFDIALQRTKGAIAQQTPGTVPGMRDVLNYILQPAVQNLVQALRTKGTVQITDTNYTAVAAQYQPPVTPAPSGAPAASGTAAAGATPAAGTAAGATPAATTAG